MTFTGHPREPETFEFSQTSTDGKRTVVIKSHVAFDSQWPFWRRWIANLRGRP